MTRISVQNKGLYEFDDYVVDPLRRQLCRAGTVIPVPQKAFQLLLYLVENPGRVLTKRELMGAVWPNSFVEEANLTQGIFLLRKALGEHSGVVGYILTVPGEGYQFTADPVTTAEPTLPANAADADSRAPFSDENPVSEHFPTNREAAPSGTVQNNAIHPVTELQDAKKSSRSYRTLFFCAVVAVFFLASGTIWYLRVRSKATLRGDIVLADFSNTTGDSAFNAALKQGLAADLEQSPNLGLVSETRIAQIMKLMAQPPNIGLSGALARQVCERTGGAALVEGSIARIGGQYVLGLEALECKTGKVLAHIQETADHKEGVLTALGIASDKLRAKLGESLPSMQKYDVPPQDTTTGSLDALEAYGLGIQAQNRDDCRTAVAFYKQAISHDPNFAMAYSHLGVCDSSPEGIAATRKAYLLRNRVSDRERFYLESHYEQYANGNLGAARTILETWAATYPHDSDPGPNLLKLYLTTGEYDRALPLVQTIVQNSPGTPVANASRLATTLLFLNRIEDAKAVLLHTVAQHLDVPVHHYYLYEIDYLENDSVAMAAEAAYVQAQPGWESNMLELESVSASSFGKFSLARSLNQQAVQAAVRDQNPEDAAGDLAEAALQEALAGNVAVARQKAKSSLALSQSSEVESLAGTAQAIAGSRSEAERTANDISRRYPNNTLARIAVATIRASDQLGDSQSGAAAHRAIAALAPASPYMLSSDLWLVPEYTLGRAYLVSGRTSDAAATFETILSHPGVTRNSIVGPLARLGLANAEEQAGDLPKARADYKEFLSQWRDSDKTTPSYRAAQASLSKIIR